MRFQPIEAPEALRRGDRVVIRTSDGIEHGYTVRNVIFGLAYEGDTFRRVILTFEEHLGSMALPNIPISEYIGAHNHLGIVSVHRRILETDTEREAFPELQS